MENRTILKLHIIFWITVISFALLNSLTYIENPLFLPQLSGVVSILVYEIITFYLFYFLISQKLTGFKKTAALSLTAVIYILASGYIITYLSYYLYVYTYPSDVPLKFTHSDWVINFVFGVIGSCTLYVILGSLAKVSFIWYSKRLKQIDMEKQNLSNELAMLRAQVNPHFLFNTLNNIKSLIISLPAKAVTSIEKLNKITNYLLFESSRDKVPLSKEIQYIQDYLELERIRYSDPDYIKFKTVGVYKDILVPPLLFMPFIENAFKHGNKLKPSPGIVINMDIDIKELNFSIKNYVKDETETGNRNSGFGLANIRRRLSLLYDDLYELNIYSSNKEFNVKLKLFFR